jgi:alkylhydroperoxidase family enzyme
MTEFSYHHAHWPVRADLVAAHTKAWTRLAKAGTWHSAAERLAIAAEARHALGCGFCAERKAALSPEAVDGAHESLGDLPDVMVDCIHRIRTDPGRLTRAWRERTRTAGLEDERYVELVGVVATVVAIDQFNRGLGLEPPALPDPVLDGTPSNYRPEGLSDGRAWVPVIHPDDVRAPEQDLYEGGSGANIKQAMTLVPDEVRGFFDLVSTQYLPPAAMRDYGTRHRAIDNAQIELLASRVSALNQCVY